MATHSSILAWEIPWTEEPCGLQSMDWQESYMTQQLNHQLYNPMNKYREKHTPCQEDHNKND